MLKDLDQLSVFVHIVQAGSLTAAARVLGQRLNTVSRRLAALEEAVGQTLFIRTTRRLDITAAGERLYEHARTILATVATAEDDLRPSDALRGRVRLAVGTVAAGHALLNGFGTLLRNNPGLSLEVHVADEPVQVFAEGFDIAIQVGPLTDSGLIAIKLSEAYAWMAAAPSYIESLGMPTHYRELVDHECLRFRTPTRQSIWPLIDGRGRRIDAAVGGRFESNNSRFLYEAMLTGLGIGFGFLPAHENDLACGRLVHVLPRMRAGPMSINALLPAGISRSPAVRAVLQVMREAMQPTTDFAATPDQ